MPLTVSRWVSWGLWSSSDTTRPVWVVVVSGSWSFFSAPDFVS
ncbi:hypothetical protein [Corallococcus sp. EGB]|nr:hypothetical protein [Corallococcus sp. EGB]